MSYRTVIQPLARRQIAGWRLPDGVLIEVHLRLSELLPREPKRYLLPGNEARGGMIFEFDRVDPQNRRCLHTFEFRIYYALDEQTLFVASGRYRMDIGF